MRPASDATRYCSMTNSGACSSHHSSCHLLFFSFLPAFLLFGFELETLYTQSFWHQFALHDIVFLSAVFLAVVRVVVELSMLFLHVHLSLPHCPHPPHLDRAMANMNTRCYEEFAKGTFASDHVLHAQCTYGRDIICQCMQACT